MKFLLILFSLIIASAIFSSGCITPQADTNYNPGVNHTLSPAPPVTTLARHWIRIDPISDFKTDATFNITGSSELIVKGTTDFPAGTSLRLSIIQTYRTRDVLRTTLEVTANTSGANSFFYRYDMKGNPPGEYIVGIDEPININSASRHFNITSELPYFKWIRMDPIAPTIQARVIPVSGTTDLPAGSQITIRSNVVFHSCTMATPDKDGLRSLCGGSCGNSGTVATTSVVEGTNGVNRWNATVDTSTWCDTEEYGISAVAGNNWTNVTPAGQDGIRIG